jgi:hypothetical protein
MAELFEVTDQTVAHHVERVLALNKQKASCRKFLHQVPGSHGSTRVVNVEHYNTRFVCHVGYGIDGERGEAFRDWATSVIHGEVEPPKPTLPQAIGLEGQGRKLADPRPTHALESAANSTHCPTQDRHKTAEFGWIWVIGDAGECHG